MLEQKNGQAGPTHGRRVVRRTAGRQEMAGRERVHRSDAGDGCREPPRFRVHHAVRVHHATKLRRVHRENVQARKVRAAASETHALRRGLHTGTVQAVPAEQFVRVCAPAARRDRR